MNRLRRMQQSSLDSIEDLIFARPAALISDIVEQSKLLCEDYIYSRLKEKLLGRDNDAIYRRPAENGNPCSEYDDNGPESHRGKVRTRRKQVHLDVSVEIQNLGAKLERTYPHLYENLSAQLCMPLRSELAVVKAMTCIGDYMFRHSVITWGRIIGLFAVAGAVAAECVAHGKGRLVLDIVIVFSELIERHAAGWIFKQGGWVSIMTAFRSVKEARYMWILTVLGSIFGFVVFWSIPIQFC